LATRIFADKIILLMYFNGFDMENSPSNKWHMVVSDIDILPAGTEDLPALVEAGRQTFHETFHNTISEENLAQYLDDSFDPNGILEELSHPESFFYLARVNGEVAGYLKVNTGEAQTEPQDQTALEVERIYVKKEWHGKSVGQALMDHALEIARDKKATYVWLGVWPKNYRAVRFYQKYGFEVFDTHTFHTGGEYQTDYLMKLPMRG